jgi:hypothetical protein
MVTPYITDPEHPTMPTAAPSDWAEQWKEERERITANEEPALEIEYGEYRIKIWSRGVLTGAPQGMRLACNYMPTEKRDAYAAGYERGRDDYLKVSSPANQVAFPNPCGLSDSSQEPSANIDAQ